VIIVGAGLAGLLAANLLRHKKPLVVEKQFHLPNNHSAVLRFRSSIISDVTGIPFRKVTALKATLPWINPIADALAYAEKNTGEMRSDRSIPMEMTSAERYIAPPNLIKLLAEEANIKFDIDMKSWVRMPGEPIISTMPMPALMELLEYPQRPRFNSVAGCNICAKVSECDAFVSLYVPSPIYQFSRVSITGDEIIAEIPNQSDAYNDELYMAAGLLGISQDRISDIEIKPQTYAKILPIDEGERTRFITWPTDNHNVYSLGRYAVWRPSVLLDDLVQDIRMIEKWINGASSYAFRKRLISTGDNE
jgi:hypothetical protein